ANVGRKLSLRLTGHRYSFQCITSLQLIQTQYFVPFHVTQEKSMRVEILPFLCLLGCGVIFSCDPETDQLECLPDSVNSLEDIIYNGHITLCNAQGSGLVYEPGVCSLYVRSDLIIFTIFSTNPGFPYY